MAGVCRVNLTKLDLACDLRQRLDTLAGEREETRAEVGRYDPRAECRQSAGKLPVAAGDIENQLARPDIQQPLDRGTDELAVEQVALAHLRVPVIRLGIPDLAGLLDRDDDIGHRTRSFGNRRKPGQAG